MVVMHGRRTDDTSSWPDAAFCLLAAKMRTKPDRMGAQDYAQLRMLGAVFGMGPAERTGLTSKAKEQAAIQKAGMR
jgi:hypothetical protein